MSDKVELEYQGKKYFRLVDLAHDYDIPARLVSYRWHSGHRNPADLVQKGRLNTRSANHTIFYKGETFLSAKEFSRKYKLLYQKVLILIKKGITDPEELIKQGSIAKDALKEMLKDGKKDEKEKTKLFNQKSILTLNQVSELTGVPEEELNQQVQHLIKGKAKDNGLGIQEDDIIKVELPELKEKKEVKNYTYVANYAFKEDVVKHILKRINIIKDKGMVQLPKPFESYFFDSDDDTIWKYGMKDGLKKDRKQTYQLKLHKTTQVFELTPSNLKGTSKVIKWKLEEIKDLLAYPEITADDLMSRSDISKAYKFPYSRNLRTVLPAQHKRYSVRKDLKLSGWSKFEVESAAEKYPKKFIPYQAQFKTTK
ncbi:hypothetical protein FP435_04605 [Lactobacillus sp. PV037]|uniref:hypothetical protein n=1 Tax=Lactobacillus sp. PV037 TaxID=2594496 RepID=UPI00223FCE1F|nr:hypothetical protein [Lactobacillus sp. PV037]QNQ83772.1 hypothetical protein FP435_04605 [Lactobacillus sp. PV037]